MNKCEHVFLKCALLLLVSTSVLSKDMTISGEDFPPDTTNGGRQILWKRLEEKEMEVVLKLAPDGLPLEPQPTDDPADPLVCLKLWYIAWIHCLPDFVERIGHGTGNTQYLLKLPLQVWWHRIRLQVSFVYLLNGDVILTRVPDRYHTRTWNHGSWSRSFPF